MNEFFEPLNFTHFIFLVLGMLAHSLVKLHGFVTGQKKGQAFQLKFWIQHNGFTTGISFLLAVIVWMVASHDPAILDMFNLKGFNIMNIFLLGFMCDATVKIFNKKKQELDK